MHETEKSKKFTRYINYIFYLTNIQISVKLNYIHHKNNKKIDFILFY